MLLTLPLPSYGTDDNIKSAWMSIGSQNEVLTLAMGIRGEYIAYEIGGVGQRNVSSESVNHTFPPNNDYTSLGFKSVDYQYGFDVLGYYPATDHISVYGGLGLYFQTFNDVARDNQTGALYVLADETRVKTGFSAGVHWNVPPNYIYGLSFHEIRGVSLQLGVRYD